MSSALTAYALGSAATTAAEPAAVRGLGAVQPHVRQAAAVIAERFGITSMGGWRAIARDMTGHPAGLAVDFMCSRETGDAMAAWLIENHEALGLSYFIWWQRVWTPGRGWEQMEDRGSPTQNHLDHVHAQWKSGVTLGLDKITDTGGAVVDGITDKVRDVAGALNPFDGWQDDARSLALQLAAVVAGGLLVVLGLVRTVK